jgi:UDP-2,3-diacylglucosamine hydrolase
MCHKSLSIQESAIFVADSHFNQERNAFYLFLKQLKNKTISTTQLFLMGDMFEFITQESHYFVEQNKKVITLLNELSLSIEIIYLEGNHDYNLEKLFPKILVVSRKQQPLMATYHQQKVALSHGDNFTPFFYNLYCTIIRNKPLLIFLNAIDFNHWLSKRIDNALSAKNICHTFTQFEKWVEKRLEHYDADLIIEGHFHQGKEFVFAHKRYINVPSLFCSQEYVVLHNNQLIKKGI